MDNIEIINNDLTGVVLSNPVYEAVTLTSAAAATWPEGTVLGRITADNKVTLYDPGAGDGSQIPKFVLPNDVEFAAAGDIKMRVLSSGRVRLNKLIIYPANDPINPQEADQLRDFTIVSSDTIELSEFDNQ